MYGTSDEEESFATLSYAANRGVTFWDTADIYGTSTQSHVSFSLSLFNPLQVNHSSASGLHTHLGGRTFFLPPSLEPSSLRMD